MKSQKGYSLVEIVIGLVVLTLFLVTTSSLMTASYNNYRLVLQRNIAIEKAISQTEEIIAMTSEEWEDFKVEHGVDAMGDEPETLDDIVDEDTYMITRITTQYLYEDGLIYPCTEIIAIDVLFPKTPKMAIESPDGEGYLNVSLKTIKIAREDIPYFY